MNFFSRSHLFPLLPMILLGGMISGCATQRPPPPILPPSAPQANHDSMVAEPVVTTVQEETAWPEGIRVEVDGKPVDPHTLSKRPPTAADQTAKVIASPTIPYGKVSRVLETLHDLGYLVIFTPNETL